MNIIHADLTPENILIEFDKEKKNIINIKIKDFQSHFTYENTRNGIKINNNLHF